MHAARLHHIIEKDGELYITGLPYKKGQHLEMIVLIEGEQQAGRPTFTARQLLQSPLVGLWQDRTDIDDSAEYARQLREQAQKR